MDRRYTILAILVIVAAFGLLVMPQKNSSKELDAKQLLVAINDPARFLSTDLVTERIISGDPTLQLIDVRPAAEFRKFALPGAINIPLDSLLSPAWKEILNQPSKDKVLYSNADIQADVAWQICTRNKYNKVFVMKGGLNQWYETIIKGTEPLATAPSEDHDLASFRKAARLFFTGGQVEKPVQSNASGKKAAEKVKVVPKKQSESSGGGC